MKISTKGRYGMRLMLDLATNYNFGFVTLRDISKRQEISEKYLEQIITHLIRANLVRIMRGSQGGYSLSADPSTITVGKILRVMEGSLSPIEWAEEK